MKVAQKSIVLDWRQTSDEKKITIMLELSEVWLETNIPPEKDSFDHVQKQREKLASIIQARTVDDWLQRFQSKGIPASIVQLQDQMADDPQVLDNECVWLIEQGGLSRSRGNMKKENVPAEMITLKPED